MKRYIAFTMLLIILFASDAYAGHQMTCPSCGAVLPDNGVFCSYCGTQVVWSPSIPSADNNEFRNSNNTDTEYDFLDLLPSNPLTHYGNELKKSLTSSRYVLTDKEKASVDGETYQYRKDSDGKYRNGHRSELVKYSSFGYPISFYYADGLVYFAIVYNQNNKEMIKLHYWGDQIIAYRDYRGNDHELKYTDDYTYASVAEEFADIFDIGMGRMD